MWTGGAGLAVVTGVVGASASGWWTSTISKATLRACQAIGGTISSSGLTTGIETTKGIGRSDSTGVSLTIITYWRGWALAGGVGGDAGVLEAHNGVGAVATAGVVVDILTGAVG